MSSILTEQYLNRIYDDFHQEQLQMMTKMKTDEKTDKTKQLSLMNTIMINVLRLRNSLNDEKKKKR